MLTLELTTRPTTTLTLTVRPLVAWIVVFCSETQACSDSLVCGQQVTARFYWDTL